MNRLIAISLILLFAICTICKAKTHITGRYRDDMRVLELKTDSTFVWLAPRFTYPCAFLENYSSEYLETAGKWTVSGGAVILNPHLKGRVTEVSLKESAIGNDDSVRIKFRYTVRHFEQGRLQSDEHPLFPSVVYVSLNKGSDYYNLVYSRRTIFCTFGGRLKHQYILTAPTSLPSQSRS